MVKSKRFQWVGMLFLLAVGATPFTGLSMEPPSTVAATPPDRAVPSQLAVADAHFMGARFLDQAHVVAVDDSGVMFLFGMKEGVWRLDQTWDSCFKESPFREDVFAISMDVTAGKVAVGNNRSQVFVYDVATKQVSTLDLDAYDARTGKPKTNTKSHMIYHVNQVRFSADGKYLAVVSGRNDAVTIWQLGEKFQRVGLVQGNREQDGKIASVAFSMDGKRVAVAYEKGKVTLSNLAGKVSQRFAYTVDAVYPSDLQSVAFSPDGKHGLVTDEASFHVYDLTGKTPQQRQGSEGTKRGGCTYTPDGQRFLCSTLEREKDPSTKFDALEVYNTANIRESITLTIPAGLTNRHEVKFADLAVGQFSPDGKSVLAVDRHAGKAYVWTLPETQAPAASISAKN